MMVLLTPNENPLFRDNYHSQVKCYRISSPAIRTGAEYYFETESGLKYRRLQRV